MTVIFPDIEKLLVEHLQASLEAIGSPLATSVRVSTKKASAGVTGLDKEVVVIGAYGQNSGPVLKQATANIEVYALDYEEASTLALLIGALITTIPGEHIKKSVVIIGPIREDEAGTQEKRSMSADLIVKGANL